MQPWLEWIAFLALAAIAVAGALGMLLTMSMYRAAIFLMASFVALAGVFLLLDADLLAAIQVMMNVGGMVVMLLFMVSLMMDPGGEMMWDMKRKMDLPGFAALSMAMPRQPPPEATSAGGHPAATGGGAAGGAEQPTPGGASADWTCPMHPEVSAPGPGACPKCGMALVPRPADEPAFEPGAAGPPAPGEAAPTAYTCPMHPEVRSDTPGACPKCGMSLVPVPAERAAPSSGYTCPMHPEVWSPTPGTCPKCGMALVPAEPPPGGGPDAAPDSTLAGHGGRGHGDMGPAGRQPGDTRQEDALPGNLGHGGVQHESGQGGGPSPGGMPHGQHDAGAGGGGGSGRMSPAAHHAMMVDMAMSTELLPWAIGIGAASALAMAALLARAAWPLVAAGPTEDAVVMVGDLLLSRYMLAFEGAAYLIFAGIVGAVLLAKRERGPKP